MKQLILIFIMLFRILQTDGKEYWHQLTTDDSGDYYDIIRAFISEFFDDSITVEFDIDLGVVTAHVKALANTGIVADKVGLFDGLYFDFADIPVAETPVATDKFLFDDGGLVRYITAKTAINLTNRIWDSESTGTKPALRKEATQNYALRLAKLASTNNNIRVTVGDSWECFGMISSIGTGALNTIDWADFIGREIVLETVGWFGIENGATAPDTKTKPIVTGVGRDLHGIRKAVLSYDAVLGSWIVKDFEKVRFSAKYMIADGDWETVGAQYFTQTGIDIEGYYNVSIFVTVEERGGTPPVAAPTEASQFLGVSSYTAGGGGEYLQNSPLCHAYGGTPIEFFNINMQGTATILVTGDTQATRGLIVMVTLPNGDEGKVTNIRVDIDYIGYTLK